MTSSSVSMTWVNRARPTRGMVGCPQRCGEVAAEVFALVPRRFYFAMTKPVVIGPSQGSALTGSSPLNREIFRTRG